jgi:hypothetical protein
MTKATPKARLGSLFCPSAEFNLETLEKYIGRKAQITSVDHKKGLIKGVMKGPIHGPPNLQKREINLYIYLVTIQQE